MRLSIAVKHGASLPRLARHHGLTTCKFNGHPTRRFTRAIRPHAQGASGSQPSIISSTFMASCSTLSTGKASTSDEGVSWLAYWAFAGGIALSSSSDAIRDQPCDHLVRCQEPSRSPFVYDALSKGIEQRREAERALREYSEQVKVMFHQVRISSKTPAEYRLEMERLKSKVMAKYTEITYGKGINPHAREEYLKLYGCSRWTDSALNHISNLDQAVIEIGAGAGQWQRILNARGVDVIAYDHVPSHESTLPGHSGTVLLGGIEKISEHPDRTLFLCYPDPSDMAKQCLDNYKGEFLIYVGEGRGGVNANDDFFDKLELEWSVKVVENMDPFPQCFERFYILQRRLK